MATERLGQARPFEAAHELLVLVEAAVGDAARLEDALGDFVEAGLIRDAVVARSGRDRARLWAYRETPYEYRTVFDRYVGFDVSVPRARIGEAVTALRAAATAQWPDAAQVIFGHIADSNLHVMVMPPGADAAMKDMIERVVYGIVAGFGGSVSAEHGIGRTKRPYLALSRSPEELALMGMMKRALDPSGLLNPGRVL